MQSMFPPFACVAVDGVFNGVEAKKDGWIVISMKNDWERIFAFEN